MSHTLSDARLAARRRLPSQWCVVIALVAGVLLAGDSAFAQGRRARLSSDLSKHLESALAGAATSASVDVIVSGSAAHVQKIAERHGATIKTSLKNGALLSVSNSGLASMANDAEVGALSGDGTLRSQLANATESTGAAAAWAGEIAKLGPVIGTGIGVAIVDSGIANHTALAGRIVVSVDFTNSEGRGTDLHGHGTHVAGIVAAGAPAHDTGEAPVGMAPGAHLVNLKVLAANGSGKVSAAIQAIDWAVEHAAQYQIRIINLSIGTAPTQSDLDDPLCQAVERATRAGLVVVAAAGNHGQDANGNRRLGTISSPGISRYAITVGALRTQGTVDPADDVVATWSSNGPTAFGLVIKPDIVAPGSQIVSLLASGSTLAQQFPDRIVLGQGRSGYFRLSGTSQAAAMVSGAAALVLQGQPQLNPVQVKLLLKASADFMPAEGLIAGGAGSLNLLGLEGRPLGSGNDGLPVFPAWSLSSTNNIFAKGLVWEGLVWEGLVWEGLVWEGLVWEGLVWEGLVWEGLVWEGLVWEALVWEGLVWEGLVWEGLVWEALVWEGLVWE